MESTIELLSNLEGNARWISDNYEALKNTITMNGLQFWTRV